MKIIVGPSEINFNVHKAALCSGSAYFETCLSGRFSEGTQGPITFDDIDDKLFAYLVQWFYTRSLPNTGLGHASCEFTDYPELYGLGDRLQVKHGFKNAVIDAFRKMGRDRVIDEDVCGSIYKYAPERSGFRRLITSTMRHEIYSDSAHFNEPSKFVTPIGKLLDMYPLFAVQVVKEIMETNLADRCRSPVVLDPFGSSDGLVDPCTFHDHEPSETGLLCKSDRIPSSNV